VTYEPTGLTPGQGEEDTAMEKHTIQAPVASSATCFQGPDFVTILCPLRILYSEHYSLCFVGRQPNPRTG